MSLLVLYACLLKPSVALATTLLKTAYFTEPVVAAQRLYGHLIPCAQFCFNATILSFCNVHWTHEFWQHAMLMINMRPPVS